MNVMASSRRETLRGGGGRARHRRLETFPPPASSPSQHPDKKEETKLGISRMVHGKGPDMPKDRWNFPLPPQTLVQQTESSLPYDAAQPSPFLSHPRCNPPEESPDKSEAVA